MEAEKFFGAKIDADLFGPLLSCQDQIDLIGMEHRPDTDGKPGILKVQSFFQQFIERDLVGVETYPDGGVRCVAAQAFRLNPGDHFVGIKTEVGQDVDSDAFV